MSDGTSEVRTPWATVCVVAVALTTECALHVAPQSVEKNASTVVPLAYGTTTRPHVVPAPAEGAGGCTSGTAAVPTDASLGPAGADHVWPPSVEVSISSWFAGVEPVFVYAR